jgi:hypothetical protein
MTPLSDKLEAILDNIYFKGQQIPFDDGLAEACKEAKAAIQSLIAEQELEARKLEVNWALRRERRWLSDGRPKGQTPISNLVDRHNEIMKELKTLKESKR